LAKLTVKSAKADRIRILEDTSGKGRANKFTVIYQSPEILSPLSIAVLPHTDGVGVTVYVAQSPDILVFEDKDGDGVADGPPRKLLSGFRGIDHDHGVHGLFIGPDRRLYFTVGDQGVQVLVGQTGGKGPTHGHREQPGVVPMLLRTYRGSPTGMCFYEGKLLPEKYWGQPLHVDAGPGRLSCYHMTVKGAAYTLGREDMVTSKDTWFR